MDKKRSIKMIGSNLYIIWFSINLYALSYSFAHPTWFIRKTYSFVGPKVEHWSLVTESAPLYPFESSQLSNYDCSEFCLYTIAIPLVLYALYKLYFAFREQL